MSLHLKMSFVKPEEGYSASQCQQRPKNVNLYCLNSVMKLEQERLLQSDLANNYVDANLFSVVQNCLLRERQRIESTLVSKMITNKSFLVLSTAMS